MQLGRMCTSVAHITPPKLRLGHFCEVASFLWGRSIGDGYQQKRREPKGTWQSTRGKNGEDGLLIVKVRCQQSV